MVESGERITLIPDFIHSLLVNNPGINKKVAQELNIVLPVTLLAKCKYIELISVGDEEIGVSALLKLKRKLPAGND